MMIGQVARRKATAAASQPPTRASPQSTNRLKTSAAISPAARTVAARRMAVACQPSHRWYTVGGGMLVTVRVCPIAAAAWRPIPPGNSGCPPKAEARLLGSGRPAGLERLGQRRLGRGVAGPDVLV